MPAVAITHADLSPFADIEPMKAGAMIDDAMAMAVRVAPCITEEDFEHAAAAKAIIRGAILRWHEAGSGALQQVATGPFSQTLDTRQQRRGMFWPTEIAELQKLCAANTSSGAYSIDTVGYGASPHADICALNFGALYCSCGAVLTNLLYPLYEA